MKDLEEYSGHDCLAVALEELGTDLRLEYTPAQRVIGALDEFANQVMLACIPDQTCAESSVVTGAQ